MVNMEYSLLERLEKCQASEMENSFMKDWITLSDLDEGQTLGEERSKRGSRQQQVSS